jgi:hypothetical protein
VTAFPGEIYRAPRSWAERAYRSRIYFDELNTGQVFAPWNSWSSADPKRALPAGLAADARRLHEGPRSSAL